MRATSYQSLALAWQPNNRGDKSFIIFTLLILTVFLGTGLFFDSIKLPKEKRQARVDIPDRVAKFILDKPKPKPVDKPKPKPKPKLKPTKKPPIKIEREKPKEKVKLTKKQKNDRKKAEKSGLIALREELSALIDTSSIDSMVGKPLSGSNNKIQIASVDTKILTAGSTESSGDKISDAYAPKVVGTTKLGIGQRLLAQKLITSRTEEITGSQPDTTKKRDKKERVGNYRSEEDIAYVVDMNKRKLYKLYRRARRSDPGIQGKIVLEVTILPSGKVESVKVTSSELGNAKLESRIIARVKQFNFGAQNVKKVTVTFPIEFLSS